MRRSSPGELDDIVLVVSPKTPSRWFATFLLAAVGAASCLVPPKPEPPPPPPPSGRPLKLVHPSGEVKKPPPLAGFMRGMNLGNGLDAPKEGEWGVKLDTRHFDAYAKAGFDHVRLPVRFSAHTANAPPFAIDEAFLSRVDWAIDQALSHDLRVIIDLHHYEELMKEPGRHEARFLAMWKQIAERYKTRPASVAFELVNEPNGELKPDPLNRLLNQTLKIVRTSNPHRIVMVEPYFWASADHLFELAVPNDDPNLLATFHCYNPILFTHQGASFMGPEYQTVGIVFPGPPDHPIVPVVAARAVDWIRNWFDGYNSKRSEDNPGGTQAIVDYFEHAQRFAAKTGLRLYLGEFAAIDRADMASRERYTRFVREEAERRGFGWAYWDDGGSMKAFDFQANRWIQPIEDALLH